MKKLIISLVVLLFMNACNNSPEYGKNVLELNRFNFNLNIEKFFADESVFGYDSDFGVSASDEKLDYGFGSEEGPLRYIRYGTSVSSPDRPLAVYSGLKFESLGMCTDEQDENVLMVFAHTDYAGKKELLKVIQKLSKEFGSEPEIEAYEDKLRLRYEKEDRVAKLVIRYPFPELEYTFRSEENYDPYNDPYDNDPYEEEDPEEEKEDLLNDERLVVIRQTLDGADEEEQRVYLFVGKKDFAEAMDQAWSYSGDLTEYR